MVFIKSNNWNCPIYQFYKNYMNDHEAEVKLICVDKPSSPLKVHGLILSANSRWFELSLNGQYNQEVRVPYKKNVMRHLIQIIYKGAVDVERYIVPGILEAARGLQVRGLDYNSLNFIVKSGVLKEINSWTSSPDCSVFSPAIDIPNSTVSDVSKFVTNPFALNKAARLSKVNNDSDKTAIGSDGKVLDNNVTTDVNVVIVGPLRKEQSLKKHQLTNSELSAPTIKNMQLNVTKDKSQNKQKLVENPQLNGNTLVSSKIGNIQINDTNAVSESRRTIDASRLPEKTISNATKILTAKIRKRQMNGSKTAQSSDRKIHKSRSSTKMDVEASSADNLCNKQQQIHEAVAISPELRNKDDVNENLPCLLESIDKKIDMLTSDMKNQLASADIQNLTQLCVICYKHYKNFVMHKRKHRFNKKFLNKYKCSECETVITTKNVNSLHKCKLR